MEIPRGPDPKKYAPWGNFIFLRAPYVYPMRVWRNGAAQIESYQ